MLGSDGDRVLTTIEFRVLGPVEARRGEARLELGGVKRRALFALLLLRRNEVVSAERLMFDLWGDDAPETAANTLQVNVSQLRKALGAERILRESGGYVLRVADGELDLDQFERGTETARVALAAGDFAGAAAALDDALALWRGPALGALDLEWTAVEASRLDELRVAAFEDRFDALLGLGGGVELVAELTALVTEHPLRERLYRQLMLALYRAGRQADALDVYRRARATLVDELGLEPSPPLRRLEQAILAQDPELDGPPSVRVSSLPAPMSTLIGREDELHEVEGLLEAERRLVTFTGPGGIGKSRLALEVARHAEPAYRDGAAFVSLAAVSEPELVAASILQSLGLAAGADPEGLLLRELRSRELLLVLDNFEHLVDAAPLVARLLEGSPDLDVLVTSRALLRLAGEYEFPVPPLSPPAAVELFVERARATASDLPTDASDEAIAEICLRLEGLPLAIELAAARVRLLPPPALLARLTSRLDVLIGARRDAPERQRTMRGAIEWSYRLLEPDEQLLFARLSVFLNGASLEAIEAVCGDVGTLDLLASLVDKSLLRQRGTEEPRYLMLETLREYALEQLVAMGDEEEIRRRQVDYFARLVQQAEATIAGPELRGWVDRLEADHANLRLAIDLARERGDPAAAVAIAGGLRMFWYVHGHAEEGLRVLDAVLADAEGTPLLERSKAHNGAAMLASDLGDYAAVRRHLLRSLELAEELGDPLRVGIAKTNLGNVAVYEQDWDEAERLYQEALRVYREFDDRREQAIVLEDLALVALARGDAEGAIAMLEEAIEHARVAEAPHEIGSARLELARILIARGESERPRRLAGDAYDIFSTLDANARIADCLDAFAGIAASSAAYDDAARLFGAAEALRTSIGAVRQPDQGRWVDAMLDTVRGGLVGDAFDREFAAGKGLDSGAVGALCVLYRS